jgi:hypothetical protein
MKPAARDFRLRLAFRDVRVCFPRAPSSNRRRGQPAEILACFIREHPLPATGQTGHRFAESRAIGTRR